MPVPIGTRISDEIIVLPLAPDENAVETDHDVFTYVPVRSDQAELSAEAFLKVGGREVVKKRYSLLLEDSLRKAVHFAVDVVFSHIRDHDLRQLMTADLALCNFNGTEVDAGTVVEFIYAKVLDIPAVVLRTDSRAAGEDLPDAEPWNLMCSGYPRAEIVKVNALAAYSGLRQRGGSSAEAARLLVDEVADRVIAALDRVWKQPLVMPQDADRQRVIYE